MTLREWLGLTSAMAKAWWEPPWWWDGAKTLLALALFANLVYNFGKWL
jgi:hypothetical protein